MLTSQLEKGPPVTTKQLFPTAEEEQGAQFHLTSQLANAAATSKIKMMILIKIDFIYDEYHWTRFDHPRDQVDELVLREMACAVFLFQRQNQPSLMNKTFQQLYNEEQELEKGLAGLWGYSLPSTSIDHSKQKKQRQTAPPNVANITLRKFGKEIGKTDKMKQVEDEIKALHNERKLMEEQQKAAQAAQRGEPIEVSQNKLIQWMSNIVEEYNSILAHKHLMKKSNFHEFTKNGLGEEESEAQKLIKEIESKRQQLKESDLKTQIHINREITSLYKEFYKGKKKPQTSLGHYYKTKTVSPEPPRSFHTLKKDRSDQTMIEMSHKHHQNRTRFLSLKNSSSDLQLLRSLQTKKMTSSKQEEPKYEVRTNQMLKKYKESQYRKHYISSRQATRQEPLYTDLSKQFHSKSIDSKAKPTRIQKDMLSPYVDGKDISTFKEMEGKIKSNNEALDIWKGKVSEACSNSRVVKKLNESTMMRNRESLQQDSEKQQREIELEGIIQKNIKIISMDESEAEGAFHKTLQIQIKNKEKEQQDIFSELLRKRNNKFNKLWGTRILVKYDSRNEAKQMLRGDSEKHPNSSKKVMELTNKSSVSRQKKKQQDNSPITEQKANLQVWLDEANDSDHYERTCKNEKINLLLKHR